MFIEPIKARIFKEGENILDFIAGHIKKVPERSVIVVTSKIVAPSAWMLPTRSPREQIWGNPLVVSGFMS